MTLEILQPIAGYGDCVAGFRTQFTLDAGMVVEVEDGQAAKWCASGIARPVQAVRETARLGPPPETAVRPAAAPKGRRGTR